MPPVQDKRILITGGAGFIGSYLVEQLAPDNDVVVYDNLRRNAIRFSPALKHPHVRLVEADILDVEALRKAFRDRQIVIHCAAVAGVYSVVKSSIVTMEVNLVGTHRVLQAAVEARVERFVDFSTSEVYGPFIHKAKESDHTTIGAVGGARWIYATSKLAAEHLTHAFVQQHNLSAVSVRPFNVYGPRQVGEGAIRGMTLRAIAGQPIVIYNDGTQIRAWCYVEDFVDGVLRCLPTSAGVGEVFNIGNPQGTITNLELARMIKRLAGSRSEIVFEEHPGPEVELRVPSIEKAAQLLGFNPTVSLEEGITRTIAWYRDHPEAGTA
ncbi:MAG: NAD-dependent epimerase/dehydratase family protein [Candidatus Rokubacteria bacterium]|nr:NAD-dependent epimerase/dehydratase family protein [Candidatus Rokubacteria bacterium]